MHDIENFNIMKLQFQSCINVYNWLFCLNSHSCNLWSWNKRYLQTYGRLILLRMQIMFWWILKELLVLSDKIILLSQPVFLQTPGQTGGATHDGKPSGTFSHPHTGSPELSSKCPLDSLCLHTNLSLSSGAHKLIFNLRPYIDKYRL